MQLRTHLVPYTDVVWLSSKSFHYPFWDRRKFHRKKKGLPAKPGSFQVFLKGFKDANVFLREHPWPDQYLSGFRANDGNPKKRRRWTESCRPSSAGLPDDAYASEDENSREEEALGPGRFAWTENLKESFREELEKLVILDYIMRNTDRGLDNWMVKVDWEAGKVSVASDPIQLNMEQVTEEEGPRPVNLTQQPPQATRASYPYKTQKPMSASSRRFAGKEPEISIGAIDNSLSWPWKHPDAWRRYVQPQVMWQEYDIDNFLVSRSAGSSYQWTSLADHSPKRPEITSSLFLRRQRGGARQRSHLKEYSK